MVKYIQIGRYNNCYTELIVYGKSYMVSTHGWYPLGWWIEYFKKGGMNNGETRTIK